MGRTRIWNRYLIPLVENFVAPYSVLRKILPQILLLGLAVYINAWVFMVYQHLDFISAIYAGVNVVTTVGLYAPNISQMTDTEKIVLIITIIFAVGLYTSIIQSIVSTVINRSTWQDAKARWRGSHMKGHTVIVGEGEIITSAVRRLERLGVDYIVLTPSKDIANKIRNDRVIIGDPKDDKNLLSAGILEAKNAIVSMQNDMDTLLITLKIQKINPPLQVISVVKDSNMVDVFKTAGADLVIPNDDIVGRITAAAAISNNVAGVIFHDRSENLIIGSFEIKKEIKIKDLPPGILPLAIIEEDGKLNPYFEKDTLLKKGEKLVVLGDPNLFKKVKEVLGE
ncbi:TrkA-N domain protein [Acidianus hospitalis W1]|uniref:TrkA-N domain protein n=1 Tax=Acidianus hospitalis (strain W1) TaxID=933801 RepID=F4B448_ACIHW|nr:NAD-binding protein [Acidianus hospitalis]AEE93012.1 TrkA-N domain protein [Acidianus hospitalis W1]